MAPRVLHLSTYDANGGAARAAHALHRAMLDTGIESRMHVARKTSDDPSVSQGDPRRFLIASELDRRLWLLQRSPNRTWRSPARFASLSAEQVNRSSADVVHLHWVTDGFLSIEQIGRISKPLVWSMYDMWPFTGTEHYGADTPDARWRTGYTSENRPGDESGVDLDRWAFRRKQRSWPPNARPIHMIPASSWLETATRTSALMGSWPLTRIPHVVDTDVFAPRPQDEARAQLGVPTDRPTLLFLASAGITDRRKGWDLLEAALPAVVARFPDVQVLVVGPTPSDDVQAAVAIRTGARFHWMGSVSTSEELRTLYAAADVTVVPSREDNMPLTAMEAQSTGCPVVGFRVGGIPDIVVHDRTGSLAEPEDVAGLADGICGLLAVDRRSAARDHALATWSPMATLPQYRAVYETVMR